MQQLSKSNVHFKRDQSHFFNCVDRNNFFLRKNDDNSSCKNGPTCTRYKPKYELVNNKVNTLDISKQPQLPNHIEAIILKCYKQFSEETFVGLQEKCGPLSRQVQRVEEI